MGGAIGHAKFGFLVSVIKLYFAYDPQNAAYIFVLSAWDSGAG